MTTSKKPLVNAADRDAKNPEQQRVGFAAGSPAPDAHDRNTKPKAQQSVETVSISVDVPKGMVLMTVTPAEATELQRNRSLASGGQLFRLMPRDWTTPLALLVPLAAVLVTDISDEGVRIAFVVATVVAAIWLALSLIARAVDALEAKSDRQRRRPVLK